MELRVRVLGGLTVDGLEERALGSRKARTLVKVLALARARPVSVDRLADVLWGDRPPSAPTEQIAVLVSRLRGVVGPDRITRVDAGYALAVDWFDLDELTARAHEAAEALAAGRAAAARAASDAVLALARGDVLPDEDGEWVEAEREAARAAVASARRIRAEASMRLGDPDGAVAAAEEALAFDPYDESALRVLMKAHVAARRPASALAAYVRVRERLVEDLGVSPTEETERLHDAIVVDDGAGTPAVSRVGIVGRDAELAALDRAFDRISAGTAAHVVVVGEAGMGKTTLLDVWLERAASAGAFVLRAAGDEIGNDLPLQPVISALAQALMTLAPAERASVLAGDSVVLAPIIGGDPVDSPSVTTVADPELGRAKLFAALRNVVTRVAPIVVLAVDDLHVADRLTVTWLRLTADLPHRLLVVATQRPVEQPLLPGADVVTLGPLDRAAVEELMGPERADELLEQTGGNPLFLSALAGAGSEAASVADAVARRLAGLGDASSSLRTAAVLGVDVDLDLLAAVARTGVADLLTVLESGVAAGILVERGTGFAFRHDLERDALASATSSARRALIHREAARALEGRAGADPLAVARHARLGGDTALAATWLVRAADIAAARFDFGTADALLTDAVRMHDLPAARTARARVRIAIDDLEGAADDASRAVAAGGGSVALEVAGWTAYYRRRYDDAAAYADEAATIAPDPALRASALALAARVRHGRGDLAGAASRLEDAVGVDPTAGLPRVWLALVRLHQGAPAEALEVVGRALVASERLAHPFAPFHARFGKVLALGHQGRVGEALAASDDYHEVVARAGEAGVRMLGPAANTRAWLLRWTGVAGEADDCNERGVEAAGAHRDEPYYAGLLDLADGCLLAGDAAGADALRGRLASIEEWDGTMAWHQRHRYVLLRARLALAAGDRERAVELCTAVALDAADRGARRYEWMAKAMSALAGGPPTGRADLQAVVDGLGQCAVLDGSWMVAALADAFGVEAWRTEAERRTARVVRSAPDPMSASRFADALLTTPPLPR